VLSYSDLCEAMSGPGVGIRCRTELSPLGGPGDKVFPPTYSVGREADYATETRRIDGQDVPTVLLDSVASQANRFELALLDACRQGQAPIPLLSVDFRGTPVADLDRISSLEASHRVFDALFRDSLLEGIPFRQSQVGHALTEAGPHNAAALYHHGPTTLLFGGWYSTGPRGGRGAKYERAITSEIVGMQASRGVKTASRLDPTGIELKAGPLYEGADGTWVLSEQEAVKEKGGKSRQYARSKGDRPGRPSQANLGNVTPSIETTTGGVTVDRILATTVISFIQLRRLRFPLDHTGTALPDDRRGAAGLAARTTLAALGLAAAALAFDQGFDLRSRCVLVADDAPRFELIWRHGQEPLVFGLAPDDALDLLAQSRKRAADLGLTWAEAELLLQPQPKLVELIRKSHELAGRGQADEDDAL
ncbi:MAG: type I-G CRISPR-associated RAMP protein Csb1/Cas7g, partial [Acidimicrobiales bacterium]